MPAQEYLTNVQHFGVKDGLSNREVLTVFQDSRGFIWAGTQYGLNRFDGKTFTWYTKEKNGLASNTISQIVEDAEGHLWLFGQKNRYNYNLNDGSNSLCVFDIYAEKIIPIQEKFGNNVLAEVDQLKLLFSTPNKTIYLSYDQDTFYKYTPKNGLQKINYPTGLSPKLQLYSSKKTIWGVEFSPQIQLVEMDTNGVLLQKIPVPEQVHRVAFKLEDEKGRLWMEVTKKDRLEEMRLFTYDHQSGLQDRTFGSILDKNNSLFWQDHYSYQANTKLFWYTGKPNFFAINREDETLFSFSEKYPLLANSAINYLFFDQNDIAWAGTDNGLYQIQLRRNPFTRYLYQDPEKTTINEFYSSRGIVQVDQQLYINCINGKGTQVIDLTTSEEQALTHQLLYPEGQPAKFNFPKGILLDQDQQIWFSEADVIRRNLRTGEEHLFLWETGDQAKFIWSFFQNRNGEIWLGTEGGLAVADTSNFTIKRPPIGNGYPEISSHTLYAFLEKNESEILLATTGGIFLLDPQNGIIDRYWTGAAESKQLPNDNIFHIHKDKNDVFWLATGGGGLVQLSFGENGEIKQQEQYTIADGLSNNTLYAIYEDRNDQLWISSDYGIIRFDKANKQSRAYLPSDGTSYPEFNRVSHFQAADGRIYFGSINGVTAFYPEEVTKIGRVYQAPLEVTGFLQYDKGLNRIEDKTSNLLQKQHIVLKPGERFFDLHFALLDYENTENINYTYQIEGVDKTWNFTREGNVRVNGLPYGQFTLKIKGQSSDGRFSTEELHIPIKVIRPLYAQPWFKWLLGGLLLGLTIGVFRWRTKALKAQQVELERQVKERTAQIEKDKELIANQYQKLDIQAKELRQLDQLKSRFFANVSHELRTPLTLILGPLSTILKRNTANAKQYALLKLMQQNGQNLLRLINEILDLSKLEAGKLELQQKPVLIYPWLRRVVSQFESHAQQKGIQLYFQFNADQYLQILLDDTKFEKVLNNFLGNALKFTAEGGSIHCTLEDKTQVIELKVSDTGQGIHPDDLPHVFNRFYQSKLPDAPTQGGTGIGLALCQEFAQLFNGKTWVESEWKKGSSFYFEFPKQEVLGVPVVEEQTHDPEMDSAVDFTLVHPVSGEIDELHRPTILLVEDNPSLRQYIQLVLQDQYEVITAENGKAALDWLNNNPPPSTFYSLPSTLHPLPSTLHPLPSTQYPLPDLIISDIMMPVMDGFQLLEVLKSEDTFRHIPVIMLTARAALSDKLKALRIGVDDYLTKPFETEELEIRIANLLKNSRERLKWQHGNEEEASVPNSSPKITQADSEWLEQLEGLVKNQIDNTQFNLNQLADQLFVSERQLHRRINKLTGLTPNKYIREIKLEKARSLLEGRTYSTVTQVGQAVGFSKVDYFSKIFKQRYGKLPSAYLS